MTTMYRVRATETDTGITRESITIHPYEAAVAIAKTWAETYYGENGATWCTPRSEGGYLVGRLHDDSFREGGTCTISVELEEDAA